MKSESLRAQLIPPLRTARLRAIPSGAEIATPGKNVRIRLKKDATSLDLFRAIYKHTKLPLPVRMEAAQWQSPTSIQNSL
jgi:hypothetical protein